MAQLGKRIFEDPRLSASGAQSCASCHENDRAFSGNNHPADPLFPVSIGAFPDLVGTRNTPSAMYMAFSPSFTFIEDEGEYIPLGGQFRDGRAATLFEQAKGPFLNSSEMAMPSKAAVVSQIQRGPYEALFRSVFGRDAFRDVDKAFDNMAKAIEAFERTRDFAPFSSKFDNVLRGTARFSAQEERGFKLFKDPEKGNCLACHSGDPDSRDPKDWLFTDFSYDNLGVPRNPEIPANSDPEFFDLGICDHPDILSKVPAAAGDAEELMASLCGAFKVPTLRNVVETAPYFHNGRFDTLDQVVLFYVTRDTNPESWYPKGADGTLHKFDDLPPEYVDNVNTGEAPYDRQPGEQPRLDQQEIRDVVAFLRTLSDGYRGR